MYTPHTCQQDTEFVTPLIDSTAIHQSCKTHTQSTPYPITISINNTLPVHISTKQKRPSLLLMKQPSQSLFQFILKLFISIFLHQHLSSTQTQSGHVHYWWHTTITLPFQFVLKLTNILWRNVSTYKSQSPIFYDTAITLPANSYSNYFYPSHPASSSIHFNVSKPHSVQAIISKNLSTPLAEVAALASYATTIYHLIRTPQCQLSPSSSEQSFLYHQIHFTASYPPVSTVIASTHIIHRIIIANDRTHTYNIE